MNKILKVEGMMCENCERHVENALLTLPSLGYANADHTTGEVQISFTDDISDEQLKETVEKEGFLVLAIF